MDVHRLPLDTDDDMAFALAREGADLLDRYFAVREFSALELADHRLTEAIDRDPDFTFALFTLGVVSEYRGDHDEAIRRFQTLKERFPQFFSEEVAYNLATSLLCSYRDQDLDRAVTLFSELTNEVVHPAMRALAHASLATVYAHKLSAMASSPDGEQTFRATEVDVAEHARLAEELIRDSDYKDWRVRETRWLIPNALGYARIYAGYRLFKRYAQSDAALSNLGRAEAELESALRLSPKNPDVLSNLGTLEFYRWKIDHNASDALLTRSRDFWTRVVADRPKINFGYYRLGQVERRLGHFTEAVDALQRALAAPFREIEQDRIIVELHAAERADPSDSDRPI